MSTLIAYASKHGSTAEIAERIGATLRSAGHEAAGSRGRVALDDDGHTRGGPSTLARGRVRDAL
jgi:flavodoxin